MLKSDLSQFDNSWYKPGSTLKIVYWYFVNLLFIKNRYFIFNGPKIWILRRFGGVIGRNCVIKPGVNIKYPWKLKIGNNVRIGEYVWIDNFDNVEIRDNVCISQGAMLLCGNHNYKKSTFDLMIGKIFLGEGSWVGAKSIVCPGVTLQSHAVLSVGSVASTDLEPYSVYKGNPAVKVKDRIIEQ